MPDELSPARLQSAAIAPAQASTDAQLVDLWLHGRGAHTSRAYRSDVERLGRFVGKPLRALALGDLQAFADSLDHLPPSSKARTLAGAKSLLSFGHRLGYLAFDVGRALRMPLLRSRLAERILDEASVHRIIAHASHALDRGAPIHLVQAALGHSSVATTGTYRHARPTESGGTYLAV